MATPFISPCEIRAWRERRKGIPEDINLMSSIFSYRVLRWGSAGFEIFLPFERKSQLVQIKSIRQGSSVLLVEPFDMENGFHSFAVAILKGETIKDFAFLFFAIHESNLE